MKANFPGYYRPTDGEFETLWKEAIFIFDANVLLNIYGYSKPTRNILVSILNVASVRSWIPHQFALEYQRNRAKAILEQVANYVSVKKELEKIILDSFKSRRKHPHVTRKSVAAVENVCVELGKGEKEHLKLLQSDPYFDCISSCFEGRTGSPYNSQELQKIWNEGRTRFSTEVPPGFADAKKPEPDCYGDLVGWFQILDKAKDGSAPVIFVTDDRKKDWWQITSTDRTIGPRPELVEEFIRVTGKKFYMYQLDQFMALAKNFFGQSVTSEALAEVRELRESSVAIKSAPKAVPYLLEARGEEKTSAVDDDKKSEVS